MRSSSPSLLLFTVCGLTITAGAACGNIAGEDLFSAAGTGGAGGAASSGATTSITTAAVTTGSDQSSSSGPATSAQSSTSTGPATTSAATVSSSTGGSSDVSVYCKGAPCADGQVCCFNLQDENLDHCGAGGSCGDGYIELSCNGPADCPNQVCCGLYNGNGYNGVICKASCEGQELVMCDGDPSVCGIGGSCNQSGYLGQGYMYCGN
jgi:hypothetical protein